MTASRRASARVSALIAAMGAMMLLALWRVPPPAEGADPRLAGIRIIDAAGGGEHTRGPVLLGISPVMQPGDYRSADAFRAKLAAYLDAAGKAGLLGAQTVVVFPEHLGTWLVALGAPGIVYRTRAAVPAMLALALARPGALLGPWRRSREQDRLAAALFRSRARSMAAAYAQVFSDLARGYGVTIVAGSIVLENPAVVSGRLVVREGPLYNVAVVFHPDGRPDPHLVRKLYPIPSEQPFTTAGAPDTIAAVATPAGRLGVLICADSWYPEVYDRLAAQDVELIAVPSFLQPAGVWRRPWGGYVTRWPADVDRSERGRLSEGEAWLAHGLAGRFAQAHARAGINVFLKGDLWGLRSDGRTTAVWATGRFVSDVAEGADIVALRLPGADSRSQPAGAAAGG